MKVECIAGEAERDCDERQGEGLAPFVAAGGEATDCRGSLSSRHVGRRCCTAPRTEFEPSVQLAEIVGDAAHDGGVFDCVTGTARCSAGLRAGWVSFDRRDHGAPG